MSKPRGLRPNIAFKLTRRVQYNEPLQNDEVKNAAPFHYKQRFNRAA